MAVGMFTMLYKNHFHLVPGPQSFHLGNKALSASSSFFPIPSPPSPWQPLICVLSLGAYLFQIVYINGII